MYRDYIFRSFPLKKKSEAAVQATLHTQAVCCPGGAINDLLAQFESHLGREFPHKVRLDWHVGGFIQVIDTSTSLPARKTYPGPPELCTPCKITYYIPMTSRLSWSCKPLQNSSLFLPPSLLPLCVYALHVRPPNHSLPSINKCPKRNPTIHSCQEASQGENLIRNHVFFLQRLRKSPRS